MNYVSSYMFATAFSGFVQLLVITVKKQDTSDLYFDGNSLPNLEWRTAIGNTDWQTTEMSISVGTHSIVHSNPSVGFLAVVSGYRSGASFAFVAGVNFTVSFNELFESQYLYIPCVYAIFILWYI